MNTTNGLQKELVYTLTVDRVQYQFTTAQVRMAYNLAKLADLVGMKDGSKARVLGMKALYEFFRETGSYHGLKEAKELFMSAYDNMQDMTAILYGTPNETR